MELIIAAAKKLSSASTISTRFLIAIIVIFYGLTFVQPIHAMADDLDEKADSIYEEYLSDISDRRNELSSGSITINDITMQVYCEQIGEPDENGYPLYIALRGGGTGDKDIANEQFEAMKYYYNYFIPNGIYVVPKCFISYYDEHYRPESFLFYDRIIEDAIAFYNVDPNRVYLVGFSSGGDGVYVVSPHLADRFAAVNMSAGTPSEWRIENMYNLPICIQVGENDTAYDRNKEAARFDDLLNEANEKYGGGFPHQTFIHVNGTHNENWDDYDSVPQKVYTDSQVSTWLNKGRSYAAITEANTSATDWMKRYERDPLPQKIVWKTDVGASLRKSQAFYWLDRDGDLAHAAIVASYSKSENKIDIEQYEGGKGTLKVYLNPEMLDVNKEVTVSVLGEKYCVQPIISDQIMRSTLYARGDRNYMFTSEIDVTFGKDGKPLSVKAVDKTTNDYTSSNDSDFYWSESGLFYVNEELFGLSFFEIRDRTGWNLPSLKIWQEDFTEDPDLKIYMTCKNLENGRKLVFLFQDRKCTAIYCDSAGKITNALREDYDRNLGELVNGLSCRMKLKEIYQTRFLTRQFYEWYQFEEWKDMYETLKLD